MTTQAVQLVPTTPAVAPDWLWTWNGVFFGYRVGDSLFTGDGTEVGRFFGHEVYGPDGRYLGERGSAEDDHRLVTNIYKKSRTNRAFVPIFETSYKKLADRPSQGTFYCGHEDFPSPEAAKKVMASRFIS